MQEAHVLLQELGSPTREFKRNISFTSNTNSEKKHLGDVPGPRIEGKAKSPGSTKGWRKMRSYCRDKRDMSKNKSLINARCYGKGPANFSSCLLPSLPSVSPHFTL